MTTPVKTWDAARYQSRHGYVSAYGESLVSLLDPKPGERILDLGCGSGQLATKIAESGANVIGLDHSPEMIAEARRNFPELTFDVADAANFQLSERVDAVFSNAALHWVRNQDAMLAGVYRALKPGGRFVAEMGGHGNIAAIRVALAGVLRQWGLDPYTMDNNFFPSDTQYHARLESAGFIVDEIALIPRPTKLPESGMRGWLETFRRGLLAQLPAERREQAIEETVALLKPVLHTDVGGWTADYVRLRFHARKAA